MTNDRIRKQEDEVRTILLKAIEDLPEEKCKVLLEEITDALFQKTRPADTTIKLVEEEKFSEKYLSNLLKLIGISARLKGYSYLKIAIRYYAAYKKKENKECLMTKELYPHVADSFNTTSSRCERAIRSAIEKAWRKADHEVWKDIFGYTETKGKLTNSEFIAMLVDYIETESK